MAGAEYAHIDRCFKFGTNAAHRFFLNYAQQFGLHIKWQFGDFIKEQGAAIGCAEKTGLFAAGAGKTAFGVTEEFALH